MHVSGSICNLMTQLKSATNSKDRKREGKCNQWHNGPRKDDKTSATTTATCSLLPLTLMISERPP